MLTDLLQTYSLRVVATDGGDTPRSSTATVKVHVVSDARRLPPQWQLIGGQHIDDLNDVSVSEDVTANTLITNINTLRLVATSSQGQVQYHLSNNGPPELNGGNEAAFKIPSPNPFNDTSIMPIATSSRNLDASTVPSYVLRCRAFVSIYLIFVCLRMLFLQAFLVALSQTCQMTRARRVRPAIKSQTHLTRSVAENPLEMGDC